MDNYRLYIHKSRYARFLDDKGRRENWDETVQRLVDFYCKKFPEHEAVLNNGIRDSILSMNVMPSMRSLMTAGPALEKDNICGYNCFSSDTQFVTNGGIKSFSEFNDGETVEVLADGKFRPAVVKNFGQSDLMKLTVKKGKYQEEIFVTENHRWITIKKHGNTFLRDEVTTGNLVPGTTLKRANKSITDKHPMDPCKIGIMHGMVYGDGTSHKGSTRITLCGDSVQFKDLFPTGSHSTPTDDRHTVCNLPWNWKQLPDENANRHYMMGFLMGWFGADGSVGKTGSNVTISNNNYDSLLWFKGEAAKLGIFGREIKGGERINPFDKSKVCELYTLDLFAETIPDYFLLKDIHKERFTSRSVEDKFQWKVVSVEKTTRVEDVWCVQVPTYEAFTLANGIETKNCSYIAVDNVKCFSEALYILMNGTGLGFSVERQFVGQLPVVSEDFHPSDTTIQVRDSKLGWAQGLQELISLLYQGLIPKWDTTKLRPAGARLKTFGGRSSGPAPLIDLFEFCVTTFRKAAGRKLNSLECHDIMCKIGEIVVVGGVRRSALISLSNLSDDRMRAAKNGQWWVDNGLRALANNSVAYTEKPEIGIFMKEWLSLYESKSGERGIFNRVSAVKQSKATGRRDTEGHEYGTNPCGEIILRPNEFCNLSEVIIRADDTLETLKEKVKRATILGTFQSSLTDFKYIRSVWRKNCEEERLLGVSLTGIMDHVVMSGKGEPGQLADWLNQLRQLTIDVNKEWADKLGIPPSVAITTVKPSGTVSQLVDSASGIHPRYSEFYVRTVRQDKKDPLGQFLKDAGVPCEDDVTKPESTWVFSFPQKAPKNAIFRNDMTAIDQLEHYLLYKQNWCEHNPSITVYVRETEWLTVGAWVYDHFDDIGGVSFLPHSDHSYRQAPYQEINEAQYEELLAKMPDIKWDDFVELTDNVEGAQTLACSAGGCEIG